PMPAPVWPEEARMPFRGRGIKCRISGNILYRMVVRSVAGGGRRVVIVFFHEVEEPPDRRGPIAAVGVGDLHAAAPGDLDDDLAVRGAAHPFPQETAERYQYRGAAHGQHDRAHRRRIEPLAGIGRRTPPRLD